jgi:hypothetical protein
MVCLTVGSPEATDVLVLDDGTGASPFTVVHASRNPTTTKVKEVNFALGSLVSIDTIMLALVGRINVFALRKLALIFPLI